jgi:pimeloyl-ACP methyl ester carboxylesterase
MKLLEWRLRREGYRVINVSYASTRRTIQELANVWLAGLLERRLPDRAVKVHFVTHSLGGIIVRQYLHDHPAEARRVGRVVMLAPPNHGSELADLLQRNFLFKLWCGPVRRQLGTDAASVPRQLGPASCEVGVIAGDRCLNPLAALFLPRPNDGRVSVRSARLEGMADFLVTHHTHTCIMWNNDVADAVARFLETGHF